MKKRIFMLLCVFTMLLCALPVTAGADVGPKDAATIYLTNPPAGNYYIDLLYINDYESSLYDRNHYDNTAGTEGAQLVPSDEAALRDAAPEGWTFVILDGTPAPTWARIDNDEHIIEYSYFGVPDSFRIMIADENGVQISEPVERTMLQQSFYYDCAANTLTPTGSVVQSYVKQIASTLLPTLLIEGLLLLPFGFSLRRCWKVFLLANLGTQVLMTATLGIAAMQGALWRADLLFVPVEFVIFLIEALVYRRWLHSDKPNPHPVIYALTANILSGACTVMSLHLLLDWVMF